MSMMACVAFVVTILGASHGPAGPVPPLQADDQSARTEDVESPVRVDAEDVEGRLRAACRRLTERMSEEPVRSGYNLEFFRPPITLADLKALTAGLDERGPAVASVRAAYLGYLRRVEGPLLESYPAARARVSEITNSVVAGEPLAVVEMVSELPKRVSRASDEMRAAEQELWQVTEPLLPPEDRWRWDRLQYHLTTAQSATRGSDIPGATIDICSVLEASVPEVVDLGAAAGPARDWMVEVWRRGVSLHRERMKTVVAAQAEFRVCMSRGPSGNWTPVRAAMVELLEAETRLLEHNRAACLRLSDYLGPGKSQVALDQFRRKAFPCVYPDPTALETLRELLRPVLAEQPQREMVFSVVEDASARRAELCDRMERAFIEFRAACRRSDPTASWPDYREQMGKLGLQRIAIASQCLASIQALVAGSPAEAQVIALVDATKEDLMAKASILRPDPRNHEIMVLRLGEEPTPLDPTRVAPESATIRNGDR
ncbi:MAG: hypothetical protein U0574_00760 [Phycisphaerales bacterium]